MTLKAAITGFRFQATILGEVCHFIINLMTKHCKNADYKGSNL